MAYMDSIFEDSSEESLRVLGRVQDILENLPPREADFVDLYYFRKLKQTDIAHLFRVSQPTVCYRLQRATARIQFLLELPVLSEDEILESLTDVLDDPLDVEIMLKMYKTTCQSEVAKQLDISQGKVRHRFIRSTNRLKNSGNHKVCVSIFQSISNSLNILREVQRPTSMEKYLHTIF
jgi:DNA-directed RNA polymerase specialized sigma24 family protein